MHACDFHLWPLRVQSHVSYGVHHCVQTLLTSRSALSHTSISSLAELALGWTLRWVEFFMTML